MRKRHVKPTKEQIVAMQAVADGGDIFNRAIAVRLREVADNFPKLITITPPAGGNDARGARPYFGASLTRAGHDVAFPRKARRSRIAQHEVGV